MEKQPVGKNFMLIPADRMVTLLSGDPNNPSAQKLASIIERYYKKRHIPGVIFAEGEAFPNDPYIAALDRIGLQLCYWNFLPEHILNPKTDLRKLIAMETKEYNSPDFSNQDPDLISKQLEIRLRRRQQSSKNLILLSNSCNCFGDSDFWGPNNNTIFPMQVQVVENDKDIFKEVIREDLGLNLQQVQETWDSWKLMNIIFSDLSKESLIVGLKRLKLSSSLIAYTESLPIILNFWSFLYKEGINDTLINKIEANYMKYLRSKIDQEGESHPLIIAARTLVNSLQDLYQTARNHVTKKME